MASITCDMCGQEQAVIMQTRLDSGDTLAAGQSCLVALALSSAVAWSEGAEPDEQAAYADLMAALMTNLAPSMLQLAKSAVPKPPRRRKPAVTGEPAQDSQPEVPPDGPQGDAERGAYDMAPGV